MTFIVPACDRYDCPVPAQLTRPIRAGIEYCPVCGFNIERKDGEVIRRTRSNR